LARIETFHSYELLHRDIKPENFVIGKGRSSKTVYIIDYGLAKLYINSETRRHIRYKENKKLTGTAKYASINTHKGIEQSRRDDLECMAYILIYFLNGKLPWCGLPAKSKEERYKKIMDKKIQCSFDDLCKGAPSEIPLFLKYCRGLKFEEEPDYVYLWRKFEDCFFANSYHKKFNYDWTIKGIDLDIYFSKKQENANCLKEEEKIEEHKKTSSSNCKEPIEEKDLDKEIEELKKMQKECKKRIKSKITNPIPKIRLSEVILFDNPKEIIKDTPNEENLDTVREFREQKTRISPLKSAEVTKDIEKYRKKEEKFLFVKQESCNFKTLDLGELDGENKEEINPNNNNDDEAIPIEIPIEGVVKAPSYQFFTSSSKSCSSGINKESISSDNIKIEKKLPKALKIGISSFSPQKKRSEQTFKSDKK